MITTPFPQHTFTHVLIGDVVAAQQRLASEDSQSHRRELIRTVFSAIEGIHWQLKRDVLMHSQSTVQLSPHEHAALLEETYTVDERGVVRAQPRFLPLPTAIRLVFSMVRRFRPGYELDFQHRGWANLKSSVDVRNRLVHPKSIDDLLVSDLEVEQAVSAFGWLLALAIEVLGETLEHLKNIHQSLVQQRHKPVSGE